MSDSTALQTNDPIEASKGPSISYRAKLAQKASQRLPMTGDGLPVGYYRVDLLPANETPPEEEIIALRNAYIDLGFEQGYPTLNDGRPFWHKLDFEPGFAFGCFQIYLEQLDIGPRELSEMSNNEELLQLAAQIHGLNGDGERFSPKRLYAILLEYSILYSWRFRAKAHDLYKEAAYRHLRLRRQMNTEDKHYTTAASMLDKLQKKVFDMPKFFDDLKPRDAIDLLAKLVNIQRISAGLPGGGPLSQKETPDDTSFEMIMRTLSGKMGASAGNVFDQNGAQVSKEVLQSVLEDKETAGMLQEVIIRVTSASHSAASAENVSRARQFKGRGRKMEAINSEDIQPYDISGAPGENLDHSAESDDAPRT